MYNFNNFYNKFCFQAPNDYFGHKGELTKQIVEDYMPPLGN